MKTPIRLRRKEMSWLFMIIFFLWGCRNDLNISPSPIMASEGAPTTVSFPAQSCGLYLKVDMETFSLVKPVNPDDTASMSPFDKVQAVPHAERVDIGACLQPDGSAEWQIIKKDPTHPIEISHLTPPDPTPKFKSAYVTDEVTYLYDENGDLMAEQAIDLSGFTQVISFLSGASGDLWEYALAQAGQEGTIVSEIEDQFLAIEKTEPSSGYVTVVMLDIVKKRMIGSTIYDPHDEIIAQTFFKYSTEEIPANPTQIYQASYFSSPTSGTNMVHENTITFHTFDFENNITQ